MATLETVSFPLRKALEVANSTAASYAGASLKRASPGGPPLPDGVIEWGHGGQFAANRIKLIPFGTGQQGSQFTMRLFGWEVLGLPDANPALVVWVPRFLCEFYCFLSNLPGPGAPTQMGTQESLCDGMSLTAGSVGPWFGGGSSTGSGSGLGAWAVVDPVAPRYLQFDFSRVADDNVSADSFNCMWARA